MDKVIFGNPLVRKSSDGIVLDKVPLSTITNKLSTPFFVLLKKKIRDNIQVLRKITHSIFKNVRISYSIKANYMSTVLQEINEQNMPFELISTFEYDILNRLSLNRENLIIGGPYLPDSLIESVIQEKNPLFILYNRDQIRRLNNIAKAHGCRPNALVRFIAPKTNGHLGFTPNESTINHLDLTISQCSNINFQGIHSHYGTQINSLDTHRKNTRYICELAQKLEKRKIITSELFNIGGGLPNAGALKENQLYSVFNAINEEFEQGGFSNPSICLEPGRFIVEDAGLFIMEIIHTSEDKSSFFVNAGTYILPRFARNSLRFYNVDQNLTHYNHRTTIYGIVPSEEDILMKNYNFSPINEIGNKIMVMNCGAYAHTFSTRFPYRIPPVVSVDGTSFETSHLSS